METKIKDPRYQAKDGWKKMEYKHKPLTDKAKRVLVHYFYNTKKQTIRQLKVKRYNR